MQAALLDAAAAAPGAALATLAALVVAAAFLAVAAAGRARGAAAAPPAAWADRSRPFVVLHQFAPSRAGGRFSNSPFCAKVEAFLLLAGVPYEVRNSLSPHARTGKLPFAQVFRPSAPEAPEVVADSSQIVALLEAEPGAVAAPAPPLAPADAAAAHLLQRTLEESGYWALVRARWDSGAESHAFLARHYFGVPVFVAAAITWLAGMRRTLWAQGAGRFSRAELVRRTAADAAAVSQLLRGRARGRVLFGSKAPHSGDAAAIALLDALTLDWDGNFLRVPEVLTPEIASYLEDVRYVLQERDRERDRNRSVR